MKVETTVPDTSTPSLPNSTDTAKLASLLALAAGAIAMPQTSEADIIYTNLNPTVSVGTSSTIPFVLDGLPGIARLGFFAHTRATLVSSSRHVTASQGAGYVRLRTQGSFAVGAAAGLTWNQVGTDSFASGLVAAANDQSVHAPNSFDHLYLAFKFKDSSQANLMCYGWVDMSLFNPANSSGPDVTIFGYAYDNTGAKIAMGATPAPEPSSAALLALGAMALGANGLRSWRRNRPA